VHDVTQCPVLHPEVPDLQRPFDRLPYAVERERLRQIVVGAGFDDGDRRFDRGIGRHENHECVGMLLLDSLQKLESIHLGHPKIGQNKGGVGFLGECVKRAGGVRRLLDRMASGFESGGQGPSNVLVVVYHKELRHGACRSACAQEAK